MTPLGDFEILKSVMTQKAIKQTDSEIHFPTYKRPLIDLINEIERERERRRRDEDRRDGERERAKIEDINRE